MKAKKLTKEILSVVLGASLLLGAVPLPLLPDGSPWKPLTVWADLPTSGNCGATGHEADVQWAFSEGTLTISKAENATTGAMADYAWSGSDAPWSSHATDITSVSIGEGITHISNYAFKGCTNFTSVVIPASVESIGKGAFYTSWTLANNHLSSVTFAEGSHLTTIDDYAFEYQPITSITIPATVTSIGSTAFSYNPNLESVTYTGTGFSIGDTAFDSCYSLSSFPFDRVTSLGQYSFQRTNFTSISLSNRAFSFST